MGRNYLHKRKQNEKHKRFFMKKLTSKTIARGKLKDDKLGIILLKSTNFIPSSQHFGQL
jgi:hypothetical protein